MQLDEFHPKPNIYLFNLFFIKFETIKTEEEEKKEKKKKKRGIFTSPATVTFAP